MRVILAPVPAILLQSPSAASTERQCSLKTNNKSMEMNDVEYYVLCHASAIIPRLDSRSKNVASPNYIERSACCVRMLVCKACTTNTYKWSLHRDSTGTPLSLSDIAGYACTLMQLHKINGVPTESRPGATIPNIHLCSNTFCFSALHLFPPSRMLVPFNLRKCLWRTNRVVCVTIEIHSNRMSVRAHTRANLRRMCDKVAHAQADDRAESDTSIN